MRIGALYKRNAEVNLRYNSFRATNLTFETIHLAGTLLQGAISRLGCLNQQVQGILMFLPT